MRTYAQIEADARDETPFSNGTSWEIWATNWCWAPCHNPAEKAWQDYELGEGPEPEEFPGGCPLILAAMMGKTPIEWLEQPGSQDYHCIEFRGPDEDGDGEPQPVPDPEGMDELFPCPPRTVRMLTQPEVMVDA